MYEIKNMTRESEHGSNIYNEKCQRQREKKYTK